MQRNMAGACLQISSWFSSVKSRLKPVHVPSSETTDKEPKVQSEHETLQFPSWPPPNPRDMVSRREFYRERMRHRKYRAPKAVFEDSSLYALYRMYEWIMTGHTVNMRNELELFWWARWPVSSIPDPGEQSDPERYAVLACIPALLVESFNERNRLGMRRDEPHSILSIEEQLQWAATPEVLETEPAWTKDVAPLETLLYIPHDQPDWPELTTLDDEEASPAFKKKNILIMKPHIHFI